VIQTTSCVRDDVYAALGSVVDPELDEPLTDLGFIERVHVSPDGAVDIGLRLPTFWCSPSFAYLMAHDAREAAMRVGGVQSVRLELCDHGQSDEISDGVSGGRSFAEVFPDETDGSLDELRALFAAKAFGMRQEQLVRALLDGGLARGEVVSLRLADVLDTSTSAGLRLSVDGSERVVRGAAPLAVMYLERRARLGLTTEVLITDTRGLLETRYGREDSTR
jgi:metal-sulfur cluster biosynthetic enzyme